jgi:Na+/H+-dicarboxylate symporter
MESFDRAGLHTGAVSGSLVWAIAVSLFVSLRIQAVPMLVVPVAVAAVPVFARSSRHARAADLGAAALMLAFVVISSFSIGMHYAPSFLLLLLAALAAPPTREARSRS